jgi:ATP synthase protein I
VGDPGDDQRRDGDKGLSDFAVAYRKAAPYMAASTSLVAAVGVFTWLGHVADGWLGLKTPWLTLAGAFVGMLGGFISFFRTVLGNAKKP